MSGDAAVAGASRNHVVVIALKAVRRLQRAPVEELGVVGALRFRGDEFCPSSAACAVADLPHQHDGHDVRGGCEGGGVGSGVPIAAVATCAHAPNPACIDECTQPPRGQVDTHP